MKKLSLFLVILFASLTGNAQVSQEGYFSIKNNLIVWTKIYETSPNIETMKKNVQLDFTSEKAGSIKKSSPIPLTKRKLEEITGSFIIEEKQGRYKVEISNIRIIPSFTLSLGGVTTTPEDFPLEDIGLNKSMELTEFFLNHMAKPYDNLFSSFFDPKKENEDW